jgi:hypothetical protein
VGLTVGASGWSGRSGFQFRPRFNVPVSLAEADARFARRRLELRGQFAQIWIDNAGPAERDAGADHRGQSEYRAIAARLLARGRTPRDREHVIRRGSARSCATRTSTRSSGCRPATVPLRQFDRDAWVIGANYWPDPDVAVKVDYSIVRSRSSLLKAPNSLNIGLGWWF